MDAYQRKAVKQAIGDLADTIWKMSEARSDKDVEDAQGKELATNLHGLRMKLTDGVDPVAEDGAKDEVIAAG